MPAVSKVLVVGGGIGGLTAATALRQQGIAVDLAEKNPDHSVYGVGIIQPNNMLRALDRIGLADECVANGAPYSRWRIFDRDGHFMMDAPNSSDASPKHPPVNGMTRPKLQHILLAAAREAGADLRVGVTVESMTDDGDGVGVTFTDGSQGRYDFVIGCDGLFSDIRQRLFPDASRPEFTGQAVWRYNVPRSADQKDGAVYFGRQTKVGLVPMTPTLMYIFVVTHEPGNPFRPREGLAAELRERMAEYGGLIADLRELITDDSGVVYKPMEHLMLPAPWHKGRAIVIGDAAHGTTPHLNQGAAMAIEDAVLLAELLGRDAPLRPLLDEFMRRRFDRAKFVVDTSDQLADWELQEWAGTRAPDARPGQLLGSATMALMEAY